MANGIVLDLSYNDIGTVDPACLLAKGVTGVICGTYSLHNPPHEMAELADLCRRGGLELPAFYGLTYFGDPFGVVRDCQWACDLARDFGVELVFMDAERDANEVGWCGAPTPTTVQRNAELSTVEQLIRGRGKAPGVYAGDPWWRAKHANTTAFAHLPLWYPNYGANLGTKEPIERVAFGGWTALWAHQFTSRWGLLNDCGRENRDASYLYAVKGDEPMTPEERAAFEDLKLSAWAGSEQLPKSREERLAYADWRIAEAAAGRERSLVEIAAEVNAGPSVTIPQVSRD